MTNARFRGGLMETQTEVGRKYKSRKERPLASSLVCLVSSTYTPRCDACRKRKICCTRDAYEKDCSLCRTRGETCKYVLPPNVRKRGQPAARSRASTSSSSSPASIPPRAVPTCSNGLSRPSKAAASDWILQFVGLSGDQDPFVLR